jgi:hypothetical protein
MSQSALVALPAGIVRIVYTFFDARDHFRFGRVCRTLIAIGKSPLAWPAAVQLHVADSEFGCVSKLAHLRPLQLSVISTGHPASAVMEESMVTFGSFTTLRSLSVEGVWALYDIYKLAGLTNLTELGAPFSKFHVPALVCSVVR